MADTNAGTSAALSSGELRALAAQGVIRTFPKNTIVVSEGDETDSFYVIVQGRVKIFVADEDGREIVLATQGPGDYFGEMVLDGGPRSASVMTLEASRFAVIPKPRFREFLTSHPEFAMHLVERLIRRTRALTDNVKSLALTPDAARVAVATGAGKLPFKAIIHVAGINLLWRSSERSVRASVRVLAYCSGAM